MLMAVTEQSPTILIIDDDRGLARIIEKKLNREGFSTSVALSGQEALAWLEDHTPALMLVDLNLPDFTGKDLIDRIEQTGRAGPFIIITGQGDERVAVEMMKRGALDYLIKDVEFLEFVPAVVHRALGYIEDKKQLAAAEVDRKRLEKEILEISEREQQRIGQDLHDDLGQQLAGIWCLSRVLESSLAAQNSPETKNAAKISTLLKDALALTRSLARGLQPIWLEAGGLAAALDDLKQRSSQMFRVECRCECPPVLDMDSKATAHLFRIAQEAVTNAIKHGQTKEIEIRISSNPHNTLLTVKDYGKGMTAPTLENMGMGLRIMKYRAAIIGGILSIKSNQNGRGTVVTCTIPSNARKS